MKQIVCQIAYLLVFISGVIFGQSSDSLQIYFPQGLSFQSGLTYCAVKDNFISGEKYTGTSTNYSFRWLKLHETYMYDLKMEIISSARVKNNSATANIIDFNIGYAYAYPVGDVNAFGKSIKIFFGPYPELYLHYREQNIANGAMFGAYSFVVLFSLGGKLLAYLPLNENVFITGVLSSNIISLGGKFIDPRDKEKSVIKLLTLFKGMRLSSQFALNYKFSNLFSGSFGYRFNYTRITAWDSFMFSSDNIFMSLTISL